jgi:hypothetical protein
LDRLEVSLTLLRHSAQAHESFRIGLGDQFALRKPSPAVPWWLRNSDNSKLLFVPAAITGLTGQDQLLRNSNLFHKG